MLFKGINYICIRSFIKKDVSRWISLVDKNIQAKKTIIEQTSKGLEVSKAEQEVIINKISNIFSQLKPE